MNNMNNLNNKFLLIRILKTIVADFKSVEKKFEQQGIEKDAIKKYLDLFKSLRDSQKLKQEDRNIDSWGKKPFEEFKEFLDSKSEEKKHVRLLKPMDGAELITENEDWFVYNITEYEAAKRYGEGSSWCITQQQWWNKYKSRTNFYFLISKKLDENNPMFKIAVAVPKKGTETYWDAKDISHKELPKELNIPKFEMKKKEFSGNMTLLESLAEEFKSEWESEEEYYNSVDAYSDSYDDYLRNPDYVHSDYMSRHLSSSAESLVTELCEMYGLEHKDEDILDILFECSSTELGDMYYTTNEISSVHVGNQEGSVSEGLQDEVSNLSEDEKSELRNLLNDNGVYVSRNFDSYESLGSEYNRLILVLNEEELEEYIETEKKRRETSVEKNITKLNKLALTSDKPKVVLEALNKIKDKKVLLKLAESNKTKSIGVKIKAIEKLGKLYKADPTVQDVFQKIVRKVKEKVEVKEAAIQQVTDQSFLKKIVLYKTKDYYFHRVQESALMKIKDQKFIKSIGMKDIGMKELALDLVKDPEYAKQMLSSKNPPYDKIIQKLPDTEQQIFKKLAMMPYEGYGDFQEIAIKRIKDQKFLANAFKKKNETTLDHNDRDFCIAALSAMNQKTLESVYDNMTESMVREFKGNVESLAKSDSLIKKLVLQEKKDNDYGISGLLLKLKDEKWTIAFLRKLKKEIRKQVIRWIGYDNKKLQKRLEKIFGIKGDNLSRE